MQKLLFFFLGFALIGTNIICSQDTLYKHTPYHDSLLKLAIKKTIARQLPDGNAKKQDSLRKLLFSWLQKENMQRHFPSEAKIKAAIGSTLPQFEHNSLDGYIINPENLKEKPTVFYRWDIFCQKCLDEFPKLNALVTEFGDRVNFIAICKDTPEDMSPYLETYPFSFLQISDEDLYQNIIGEHTTYMRMVLLNNEAKIHSIYYKKNPWFQPYQPKLKIKAAISSLLPKTN